MTLRRRIVAILRPWLSFFAAGLALTAAVMALVLVMFPSIVTGNVSAYRMAPGPHGGYVRVLELPYVPCHAGGAGCYEQHVVMGYGNDLLARQHEYDHVAGMQHGAWYAAGNGHRCAEILAAGQTKWTVGRLICRRQNGIGDFFEVSK